MFWDFLFPGWLCKFTRMGPCCSWKSVPVKCKQGLLLTKAAQHPTNYQLDLICWNNFFSTSCCLIISSHTAHHSMYHKRQSMQCGWIQSILHNSPILDQTTPQWLREYLYFTNYRIMIENKSRFSTYFKYQCLFHVFFFPSWLQLFSVLCFFPVACPVEKRSPQPCIARLIFFIHGTSPYGSIFRKSSLPKEGFSSNGTASVIRMNYVVSKNKIGKSWYTIGNIS